MPIAHKDLTRIFAQYLEGSISREDAIASAVFYPNADRLWLASEIDKIENQKEEMRDECIDESINMAEDIAKDFEADGSDHAATMLQAAAIAHVAVILASRFPKASYMLANTSVELARASGNATSTDLQ